MNCIPKSMREPVIIYLLAVLAASTLEPDELVANAKCMQCIPPSMRKPVMIYLLNLLT